MKRLTAYQDRQLLTFYRTNWVKSGRSSDIYNFFKALKDNGYTFELSIGSNMTETNISLKGYEYINKYLQPIQPEQMSYIKSWIKNVS